jgi:hypothetical protein
MGLTNSGAPRASYNGGAINGMNQEVSERSAAVLRCRSEPKLVLDSMNVRLLLLSMKALIAVTSFPQLYQQNSSHRYWVVSIIIGACACAGQATAVSRIANAWDWKALLGILAGREGDVVETRLWKNAKLYSSAACSGRRRGIHTIRPIRAASLFIIATNKVAFLHISTSTLSSTTR